MPDGFWAGFSPAGVIGEFSRMAGALGSTSCTKLPPARILLVSRDQSLLLLSNSGIAAAHRPLCSIELGTDDQSTLPSFIYACRAGSATPPTPAPMAMCLPYCLPVSLAVFFRILLPASLVRPFLTASFAPPIIGALATEATPATSNRLSPEATLLTLRSLPS